MSHLKGREAELESLKELHGQGLNDCEIARKLNVNRNTIHYQRRFVLKLSANCMRGHRNTPIVSDREILIHHELGLNNREIGDKVGMTKSGIFIRLKKLGISSNFKSYGLKFGRLKEDFIHLYLLTDSTGNPSLTLNQIAKKLEINKQTVWNWSRKLNLPTRLGRHYRNTRRFNSKCYILRKNGLSDYEIAQKLNVSEYRVKLGIGRFLTGLCRQSPTCLYKALLPEVKT